MIKLHEPVTIDGRTGVVTQITECTYNGAFAYRVDVTFGEGRMSDRTQYYFESLGDG